MSDVDVAIVGAGPYGLSLAAHLSARGVSYRHFGVPMWLWRGAMPTGMFLKSQGFASNLSDPQGTHTLEAFCRATGRPYQSYGLPVPLDTFTSYGHWFQHELGLKVEEVLVTGLAQRPGGFGLTLADGEQLTARQVVVAIGVEHFAYVPPPLSDLPASACTHSSAHTDLAAFRGQDVVVVGAGQSALESAALLHENGAAVQILAREPAIAWNGRPLDPDRPLRQRLREPESGLGSGWATWFYSNHPELFRRLPQRTRVYRARTALGPAGASWLRERVEGQFPVRTGQTVAGARQQDGKVLLKVADGELAADHVIAATGYRIDLTPPALPAGQHAALAADGGRERRGRAGLPVLRSRALLHRAVGGPDHGAGHAVRLRIQARRDHGRAPAGRRLGPQILTRHGRPAVMLPHSERDLAKPGTSPGQHAPALAGPGTGQTGTGGPRPGRPRRTIAIRSLALPAADTAALVAATAASGVSRGGQGSLLGALYIVGVLAILAAGRLHRLRICLRVSDQAGRILVATTGPALALLAWRPAPVVLGLMLWSGGLVIAGRGLLHAALRAAHRRGRLAEPAVIIGTGTFGAYLAELMQQHPELGLRPAGLLDYGPPRLDLSVPSLGRPADLADVVRRLGIRRVIVCFSSSVRDEDVVTLIRAARPLPADVCVVPRLYELGMAVPRGCLDEIWGIPLIPLRGAGGSRPALALKRVLDGVISAVLLTMAAPLILALILAVRLRTGQPALFRQARVTGPGQVAPIVKVRTLAAHDDHDTRWAVTSRPGRLGRWLRVTHLDELPQLTNVLRGQMSLVGPRPERPYFADRFGRDIPRYADRSRMPAGLTGWAQVNGLHGDTSIFERARFDNYYVEYWSIWLDLVILARTLAVVIRGGLRTGGTP